MLTRMGVHVYLAVATDRVSDAALRLTAMAWDAIEAADLDELAFLLGATFIDTLGWNNDHGVRAILENRTLRQLAGHDRHDGSLAAPLHLGTAQ